MSMEVVRSRCLSDILLSRWKLRVFKAVATASPLYSIGRYSPFGISETGLDEMTATDLE